MKQVFRRSLAVLLSLTLALCMSVPAFAAAFPMSGGAIKITGTVAQLAGKEINALRILDITEVTEAGTANNLIEFPDAVGEFGADTVEYSMNLAWLPFIVDKLLDALLIELGAGPVYDAVSALLGQINILEIDDLTSLQLLPLLQDGKLLNLNLADLQLLDNEGNLLTTLVAGGAGPLADLLGLLVDINTEGGNNEGLLSPILSLLNLLGLGSGYNDLLDTISSGGLSSTLVSLLGSTLNLPGTLGTLVTGVETVSTWLVNYLPDLLGNTSRQDELLVFAEEARTWADSAEGGYILNSLLGIAETTTIPAETVLSSQRSGTVLDAGWSYPADGSLVTVTFNNLTTGMYLIDFPNAEGTLEPILVNVPSTDALNIDLKHGKPTVDKKASVDSATPTDDTSVKIGDTVTFTLTATIPWWAETNYYYKVVDTMSTGLSYTYETDSIDIRLDGGAVPLTDNTDTPGPPVVGYTVAQDGQEITIDFGNLDTNTEFDGVAGNAVLTITYDAVINEYAVVGEDGNTNTAKISYGTDGMIYTDSGTDTSTVYTYPLIINKYDRGNFGKLSGAEFFLSLSENPAAEGIRLMEVGTGIDTYRLETQDEAAAGEGTGTGSPLIETDVDGKLTIQGLAAGTYYLHENKAPIDTDNAAPNNKNYDEMPVMKITIDPLAASGTYPHPIYSVRGEPQGASETIAVPNGTGLDTGGMGTVGLTILGVAVIAGGVIFTSRKSRKNNKMN